MSFCIRNIQTRIVDHRVLTDRIVISCAGRHDTSRFIEVVVRDDDGVYGFGEGATVPGWSGESAETAQWMIENLFAPAVVGVTFDHPREVLAILDSLAIGNPFTKSAIDTACWDLWARKQNVSVSQLIADREPVPAIPTRVSIGAYPVGKTVQLARLFWELGVRVLKFKVGVPGISDTDRLKAVRDEFGDEAIFTVDVNAGYEDVDQAVRAIEAMLPFDLALVEQPTPRQRIKMMAEVRRRVSVPILADESIFTPSDLAEAIELDAFDMLSVYPGKNGGFTHSVEMAKTAQRAGKACAIGSCLETDIGQAAMATLASSLSAFPVNDVPCDLASSLYYELPAVKEPLEIRGGCLIAPGGPGFGVEPLE